MLIAWLYLINLDRTSRFLIGFMVSLANYRATLPMQSGNDSRSRGHQIMVSSPQCILNCQALSIHLPPLRDPGDTSGQGKYLTPPMSVSPGHSQFGDAHHIHHKNRREQTLSPTSAPPYSSKQISESVRTGLSAQSRPVGQVQTPVASPGVRTSLHQSSTSHPVRGASHDEQSSINQDSPELLQLTPGAPGVARRAKAHVPSACVNCKRKHLACETRRPCNRCVQTGKEVRILNLDEIITIDSFQATCVDVQHKKRGRPRLREEENVREVAFGTDYSHAEHYPNRAGVLSIPQPGRRRSKSYRELRSQPETSYGSQRPRTSEATFPHQQQFQGSARLPLSPTASYLSESIPTVLLTPEFVVAQHNYAFADALSLSYTAEGHALTDLEIPSEREKIQRLQTVLRAELLDAAHLPPLHGSRDARITMPAIEELDIAHATAGFRTRSEYWMFRASDGQSRGFPITVSLARTGAYFVVLTLVQNTGGLKSFPSPRTSHNIRTSQLPSPSSAQGARSPSLERHAHQPLSYTSHLSSTIPDQRSLLMQPSHIQPSHPLGGLAQYRQRSPPRSSTLPYGPTKTSAGSEPSTAPQTRTPRDSLRHLQLPPIRTAEGDVRSEPRHSSGGRSHPSSGKQSPAKGSPVSGRKKKRRRVEIGDMLH